MRRILLNTGNETFELQVNGDRMERDGDGVIVQPLAILYTDMLNLHFSRYTIMFSSQISILANFAVVYHASWLSSESLQMD